MHFRKFSSLPLYKTTPKCVDIFNWESERCWSTAASDVDCHSILFNACAAVTSLYSYLHMHVRMHVRM